jgi:hypothetical protein
MVLDVMRASVELDERVPVVAVEQNRLQFVNERITGVSAGTLIVEGIECDSIDLGQKVRLADSHRVDGVRSIGGGGHHFEGQCRLRRAKINSVKAGPRCCLVSARTIQVVLSSR